jgi:hypothetical protein
LVGIGFYIFKVAEHIPFYDVHPAQFPGPFVNIAKNIAMYRFKVRKVESAFNRIKFGVCDPQGGNFSFGDIQSVLGIYSKFIY